MKEHKLTEQEIFELVEYLRHINHWDSLLKAKIGFMGQENGLDPKKGKVELNLEKKILTYTPKTNLVIPKKKK